MSELVKYDALMNALAEAKATDEILHLMGEADVLQHAARVAGNKEAEADLAVIRFRAERHLGQIMAQQKSAGLMAKPGRNKSGNSDTRFSLQAAGINKPLADRARKLAAVPEQTFDALTTEYRARVVQEGEKVTRHLIKAGEKAQGRADRERQLGERIASENARLDTMDRKYGAAIADPPWSFESYSELTGMDRAPDNHYPTMKLDDIIALGPRLPFADDCVIGLWAWAPMLPEALQVLQGWGFTYKTHCVWRKIYPKNQTGMGYWFRFEHELLLIGTRGSVVAPEMGTQWKSVQEAPVVIGPDGRVVHSAKPRFAHRWVEEFYPSTPKIELFSRSGREGWESWGAEAPNAETQSAAG